MSKCLKKKKRDLVYIIGGRQTDVNISVVDSQVRGTIAFHQDTPHKSAPKLESRLRRGDTTVAIIYDNVWPQIMYNKVIQLRRDITYK